MVGGSQGPHRHRAEGPLAPLGGVSQEETIQAMALATLRGGLGLPQFPPTSPLREAPLWT